jgi:two-component system chemotaxis response regulator CheY
MPGMTGLEMLEALRALPQPVTVPVVMLTTEGRPDLIDQSRKSGAKGWIVKPFRADQLTAIVRRIASA